MLERLVVDVYFGLFHKLPDDIVEKLGLHIDDLPVQPDHSLVPWEHDLMWELQVKRAGLKMTNGSAKARSVSRTKCKPHSRHSKICRARNSAKANWRSVGLAQQLELFGD